MPVGLAWRYREEFNAPQIRIAGRSGRQSPASRRRSAIPGPGCHFGEVIDGSTADEAQRKIEAAGFSDVHALKKSCDNFWHGKAILTGRAVNVVLSPSGKVMLKSD
jgi:hypothetical protein